MSEHTKNELESWIKSISLAIFLALFLKAFIFTVTYVDGESMYPTLENGDRLILTKYKTTLGFEEFNRGDIIVFSSPTKDKDYIKRIIGLENDIVIVDKGIVYVNNEPVDEYYIEDNIYTESIYYGEGYKIPKGKLFVIGDNRNPKASYDSRNFGPIKIDSIKGKTKYRVYPNISELK